MLQLKIDNLSKRFGELKVLEDFSICFSQKINCIFGPSGCGKSTLVNLMTGLVSPDKGNILGLENVSYSYIFQEDRLLPWATIKDNIMFVLESIYDKERSEELTDKYLSLVDLADYKNHYPQELSGGMKQRVSIARAFAYGGDILIMDEPFKGLHLEIKKDIMNYIGNNMSDKLVFFITHDVEEALYLADSIYIFKGPPLVLERQIDIDIPFSQRQSNIKELEIIKNKIINGI